MSRVFCTCFWLDLSGFPPCESSKLVDIKLSDFEELKWLFKVSLHLFRKECNVLFGPRMKGINVINNYAHSERQGTRWDDDFNPCL